MHGVATGARQQKFDFQYFSGINWVIGLTIRAVFDTLQLSLSIITMKQTVDWHQHWTSPTPGFHEGQVNPYLTKYLPLFDLQPGDSIFMPLCGKAVDILWLAEQGFEVIGVELSQVAVESFFEESGLQYEQTGVADFKVYRSANITLYQGDFMNLKAEQLAACKLVYDRASIVAIEPFNRASYKTRMLELVPVATPMLMVVLDYRQGDMNGPPFSVPVSEVTELYKPEYQVELLQSSELIEAQTHWKNKGLNSMLESVLKLTQHV